MGIHSGPVSKVTDLNGRTNIAGAGINLAQRVMDCGDSGHILLSRHAVEDLAQYRQWSARLHDLGECEVKHGIKLSLANLFGDDFGNAAVPAKLAGATTQRKAPGSFRIGLAIAAVLLLVAGIIFFRFKSGANFPRIRSAEAPPKSIAVLPFDNLSRDPENAYFALDPRYMALPGEDQHGFRAIAQRSALADAVKDSGAASMFPALASPWTDQLNAQKGWEGFHRDDFLRLKKNYGVDWIVIQSPGVPGLPCPYATSQLLVCRIE